MGDDKNGSRLRISLLLCVKRERIRREQALDSKEIAFLEKQLDNTIIDDPLDQNTSE